MLSKKAYTYGLILLGVLSGYGCESGGNVVTARSRTAGIFSVFFFDTSGSARLVRTQFLDEATNQLAAGKPGDRFYTDAITAGNVPTYPIRWEVPTKSWNEYDESYQCQVNDEVQGYAKDVKDLFISADTTGETKSTRPEEKGTDILLSAREAAKLLQSDEAKKFPIRRLVIYSDMIQQSPDLDMSDAKLSDRDVARLLQQLADKGFVPDLAGIQVYVVGAGVKQSRDLTADRRIQIERFWTRYFAKCNADFNSTRYGGSVLP